MRVSTISGSVSFAAQTSIVVNQYLAVTIVYMLQDNLVRFFLEWSELVELCGHHEPYFIMYNNFAQDHRSCMPRESNSVSDSDSVSESVSVSDSVSISEC